MAKVTATLSNDENIKVFEFFDDELSFVAKAFIGMTVVEALDFKQEADVRYLQS